MINDAGRQGHCVNYVAMSLRAMRLLGRRTTFGDCGFGGKACVGMKDYEVAMDLVLMCCSLSDGDNVKQKCNYREVRAYGARCEHEGNSPWKLNKADQ